VETLILDATAGNRTMWKTKNAENIVYIDVEKRLAKKPTIFADNTNTPFLPETFDTIFYDPPHSYATYTGIYSYPDSASFQKDWRGYGKVPRYYGWDKYKSAQALLAHIYRAQEEFKRILKADGLLWVKWNDLDISVRRILAIFHDWDMLLQLYIKSPTQTFGKKQTYWICLTKKKRETVQTALL